MLVLAYLGVFVYLIARGDSMHERGQRRAAESEEAVQSYIREVASPVSTAEELTKLAQLRDQGVLTSEEFEAQKAKLLTT